MGLRIDQIDKKIETLESLWDKLDRIDTVNSHFKQQSIQKQLEKLRKEKQQWIDLYTVVKEQLDNL